MKPEKITISVEVAFSSPSDFPAENYINMINNHIIDCGTHYFKVKAYNWQALPPVNGNPQNGINEDVIKPADIVTVWFHTSVGSNTLNYRSGTIEELNLALQLGKKVMLYIVGLDGLSVADIFKKSKDLLAIKKLIDENKDKLLYKSVPNNPEKIITELIKGIEINANKTLEEDRLLSLIKENHYSTTIYIDKRTSLSDILVMWRQDVGRQKKIGILNNNLEIECKESKEFAQYVIASLCSYLEKDMEFLAMTTLPFFKDYLLCLNGDAEGRDVLLSFCQFANRGGHWKRLMVVNNKDVFDNSEFKNYIIRLRAFIWQNVLPEYRANLEFKIYFSDNYEQDIYISRNCSFPLGIINETATSENTNFNTINQMALHLKNFSNNGYAPIISPRIKDAKNVNFFNTAMVKFYELYAKAVDINDIDFDGFLKPAA